MDKIDKLLAKTEEEIRRGELLAEVLGLKMKPNGRYDLRGGDKTPLGLFRTVRRIIETGEF